MDYLGTGFQAGNRGTAGIGKQVEHLYRTVSALDHTTHQIPIHSLFREQAGVLKAHGLDVKSQVLIAHLPHSRNALKGLPLATAGAGAHIACPRLCPQAVLPRAIPDHLWVRTNQDFSGPTLQLFAGRAVYQFIIFPVTGYTH